MKTDVSLLTAMNTALEKIKKIPPEEYIQAVGHHAANPTCFGEALRDSSLTSDFIEGRQNGN
jgi:hypothetical protein